MNTRWSKPSVWSVHSTNHGCLYKGPHKQHWSWIWIGTNKVTNYYLNHRRLRTANWRLQPGNKCYREPHLWRLMMSLTQIGVAKHCSRWLRNDIIIISMLLTLKGRLHVKSPILHNIYFRKVYCHMTDAKSWIDVEIFLLLAINVGVFTRSLTWSAELSCIITWWWALCCCRNSLLRQKSPCFDRKSPSGNSCCWTYPLYKIFMAQIAIKWSVYKLRI